MNHTADVLVIGGGLAGSAAAIRLARAGRHVLLLERDREPKHKVCGEFLSAEAVDMLQSLGVSPEALGGTPIHTVRLCAAQGTVQAALPFPAISLTRKLLDAALLNQAASAGADLRRGETVQTLESDPTGWVATTSTGERFTAPNVVLACGKHDLRGLNRPAGSQRDLVAMKMYLRLAPAQSAALAGNVELLLHSSGYAGLQPVEDGAANLCALVRRSTLTLLGGKWDAIFDLIQQTCPAACERLAGAYPLLEKPLALSAIPYGFVRAHAAGDGLWAVGDQAAVIPSFTGDGMSIALFTGLRAAQSILENQPAEAFQRQLHRDLRFQVARATAISRALVHEPTRAVAVSLARRWPALLPWTAANTRIPTAVIQNLQLAT